MKLDWTLAKTQRDALLDWYRENLRPLPWRENRDAYRIWISETMLQQTTTTAVIPFFHRFIERFPTLEFLAAAEESEVKKQWAGLGYYSRASNLWRAAKLLAAKAAFPQSYQQLLEYPGFGPYTARAVSSLAFGEEVGVLDGNVIRVLSRHLNWSTPWWTTRERQALQTVVDSWVKDGPSHEINQALMELGATVCTPKNPACVLCPLQRSCRGLKARTLHLLPLPKPRREREIWIWQPKIFRRGNKVALALEHELPFLRRHWVLPGSARRLNQRPKKFDFSHSITHHDIFVTVQRVKKAPSREEAKKLKWFLLNEISSHAPSSLIKKALARV